MMNIYNKYYKEQIIEQIKEHLIYSDKSVKKSIDKKVAYNGFLYKYLDEKLVC